MSRAQVCAPDDRPGTDTEIVQACCDERRDPPFGFAAVIELVVHWVPEEGGDVVLALRRIRLRVDGEVPNSMTEDVVVVKIAVHDPACRLTNFGKQLSCQRDEVHSPHWRHGQANAGPQAPPDGTAAAQDATTSMRCRPLSLLRPLLAPPRDHRRERRAPPTQPVPSDLSGAPLHRLPTAPAHPARAATHRRRPTQPSRPGRRRARHTKPSTVQTPVRARDPSVEQPPPRKPPQTPGRGESDPFPEATVQGR